MLKELPGVRAAYRSRRAAPIHAFFLDRINRYRHGTSAPRFAECLWIEPAAVKKFTARGTIWQSARVRRDWIDDEALPLDEDPVLRIAIARWRDGLPWENTGEFELLERAIWMECVGGRKLRSGKPYEAMGIPVAVDCSPKLCPSRRRFRECIPVSRGGAHDLALAVEELTSYGGGTN